MSYKAWMTTHGDQGTYSTNALAFATRDEADLYARDLSMRWTAVVDYEVRESTDPVNRRLIRTPAGLVLETLTMD